MCQSVAHTFAIFAPHLHQFNAVIHVSPALIHNEVTGRLVGMLMKLYQGDKELDIWT